jgi:hypothetical protein
MGFIDIGRTGEPENRGTGERTGEPGNRSKISTVFRITGSPDYPPGSPVLRFSGSPVFIISQQVINIIILLIHPAGG